ncbi:ESPL1 protein, partial [Psilopogon haemacephalus]|nr:ESPL1 protein [Psilopogon haemacephalus]
LGREEVLSLCAFTEGHCQVLHQLLEKVPADGAKQQLLLKQLLYRNLQLFTNVIYDTFQGPQTLPLASWAGVEQLRSSCERSLRWMLEALEGLPANDRAKYLDVTASCTFRLAYIFYSQNLHQEASSLCQGFCERLLHGDGFLCPEIPPERLHKCFRLHVESLRKLGQLERALGCVVQWLLALQGHLGDLLAEPVSLWVRVKVDVAKQGPEELRLRTLKDGLAGHQLEVGTLVTLLFAELKAYKAVRGDTGQERYNVLCDLLELCPEGSSSLLHQRAASLTELAQLLCYHSYTQQTDCSSLDSIHEALRLLEMVPRSSQNEDQLLDDQAQALLWLFICTLEANMQKGIEREQRAKAQGLKDLEEFEPNDLKYEGRQLEDRFLYQGISSNLQAETALCQSLDAALALWKQLLASPRVPALRSPEQTVASLQLLAALYKLLAKPLQAMDCFLLLRALCSALGDSLGTTNALCQLSKLLCQLDCPSYAQVFLEEAESCLQEADSSQEPFLLLQQTCLLLRCQLCCATHQIVEGQRLLLELLQHPALQKVMKVWYLLRAHVLWLLATYLSLPPAHLPAQLRQQLLQQGWKTPKAALAEAQKLFRSILLLLMGGDLLGCQKAASDAQFVDCGDNLLLKWQVLGDMLAASEQLVALLSSLEVVCRAKAFCLDAVKVAMKLQAARWCTSFLVLKAQLELQQNELELSHLDLQQALFILESDTGERTPPKKNKPKGSEEETPKPPEEEEEEEGFLSCPALPFLPTLPAPDPREALTASPQLKPSQRKTLTFLHHPATCSCSFCSDLLLSALCLRWFLCRARAELAGGSIPQGLALLRRLLPACASAATRFASRLRDTLQGVPTPEGTLLPAPGLLDQLVASVYTSLALQSLGGPQPAEELEDGLSFLASCSPHLPTTGVSKASLLLAKATATFCQQGGGPNQLVLGSCFPAWQLPAAAPPQPTAPQALKVAPPKRDPPKKKKTTKTSTTTSSAPAAPKAGVRKSRRRAKGTQDVFAMGDSDSEVPTIVLRPQAVLSSSSTTTPCPKSCALPTKPRLALGPPRTPFTIFSESSSPPLPTTTTTTRSRMLLRAPRAVGKVRSRLQVTFSDDSDLEEPKVELSSGALRKASCARRVLSPRPSAGCQGGTKGSGGHSSGAQPRRGRPGPHRAVAGREEKKKEERRTRRGAGSRRAEEELDPLRAAEEQEKELELSFEALQLCQEEEGVSGELPQGCLGGGSWLSQTPPQEVTLSRVGGAWPGSLRALFQPFPWWLPEASSPNTALKLLKDAFNCICHCPPGTLYSQLCQLLAQALGDQDPLLTAYLLTESVSITTRHQLLQILHRKIHKQKKAAGGDVAEQLQELSLQQGGSAQPGHHHLEELQDLFSFSSTELGSAQRDKFQEQLQQIPSG